MKKHATRIVVGVLFLVVLIFHAAKIFEFDFLTHLEARSYDLRLNLTMPNTVDNRVVIVDIDEKSLAEEGRWPWSRDRMALLMDKLFDRYQISVLGFDVVFAEKDESSGLKVLQKLAREELKEIAPFQTALTKLKSKLDRDQLFANAIKGRRIVLGYYFSSQDVSGVLPPPVFPKGVFKNKPIHFTQWGGYGANLPELQASAASAGHFNTDPDIDGVSRRVPMLAEYNGAYYESLSLAMTRVLLGSPPVVAGFPGGADSTSLEWLQIGPLKIPVDARVRALVPFRGKQASFKYIPAADVLRDRIPMEDLKNKIVLIGTSAPGLLDLRVTPVSVVYPGVEIHANLIAGMLDQNIKEMPPYILGGEVVLLLLIGLLLAWILPFQSPLKASVISLSILLGVVILNLSVWQYLHLVLPIATSLFLIMGLFALNMSYGFFVETRLKRQITGRFGQYVPPALVDEMAQNPENFSMEGESRELTVVFSDVRNFTTISEKMDPRELSQLMNDFLTPLTEVIYKYRGTIDKYMGDCIMAFWGAPLPDAQHARHALLAGMEMHEKLKELQPKFKEKGWPELRIGIGLNTGRMSVGNMGSKVRVAYTVMGDAVNLASRLEGITKEYGVGIVVGEATKAAVTDFIFRELDRVRVKGKTEPIAIFEPLGAEGQVDKEILSDAKIFSQALKLYRAQNWDMAELQLLNLQKSSPDSKLYALYLERIKYFRANPPGDHWDGVFEFKAK